MEERTTTAIGDWERTSHWDYRKIHLCSIWLKIGMLVDFEVLNNVLMDLEPLARLLDPNSGHKGHNREKSTSVRFDSKLACL